VAHAVEALGGSGIAVASVATAFPSGRASLQTKLVDVKEAVSAGATEIDMVIDRGAFLAGRYVEVDDEILAGRQACGAAHLNVIGRTAELARLDIVRRASGLAWLAGGASIKPSPGRVRRAAPPPVALVMLEAVRDFAEATGERRGVKLAGGIRAAKEAVC